jgi:hypothetical protein
MNTASNVTFLTLSIGSLAGVVPSLTSHDWILSAGLLVFGLVMVFVYEKTPPTVSTV